MKKLKSKQSVLLICLFTITLHACASNLKDASNNLTDSTMITTERFDFEEWKLRLENGTTFYTKEDGTKVRMSGTGNPYISEILPPPSFLKWQRFYYENGNLRMSGHLLESVPISIWRTYDERGNLIKEVNEDAKFGKIKPSDILYFLEKEGYINLKTGEGRFDKSGRNIFSLAFVPAKESVIVGAKKFDPLWYITINPYFENRYTKIDYIIDGNTGEVIEKKIKKIFPIE